MVKHWQNDHKDKQDPPNYKYEVISSHMTAISRQLGEGLAIEEADPNTLINGKGVYGSNRIPRYKLTLDDQVVTTSTRNQAPQTKATHDHDSQTQTTTGDQKQPKKRHRSKYTNIILL